MLGNAREWIVSPSGVKAWSRFFPGLHNRLDRPRLSDLTQVRRLGVLRPDGIGDMILTSGLLRELRRQLPATRITLICQASWASWMRTCPWVDARIPVVVVNGVADGAPAGTRGESQTGPYDTLSRVVRPPAGTPSSAELNTALVPADAVAAATLELLS